MDALTALTGWHPKVTLQEGIHQFVSWYRAYSGA